MPPKPLAPPAEDDYGASAFQRRVEQHTGSPDGTHTAERESELFRYYADGKVARTELETFDRLRVLAADVAMQSLRKHHRLQIVERIERAKKAAHELLEVNFRFIGCLARASLGMPAPSHTHFANRPKSQNKRAAPSQYQYARTTVGTYGDIGLSTSPYAELEERTQNGVLGFMKALDTFSAKSFGQDADAAYTADRFTMFAAWRIQKELERATTSTDYSETLGPSVRQHVIDKLNKKRNEYNVEDLREVSHECDKARRNCQECEDQASLHQLEQWCGAQYHTLLDDIAYPYAAIEETWDTDWDEPPVLSVAEVVAMPESRNEVIDDLDREIARQVIDKVLKILPTRSRNILCARLGWNDGITRSAEQIGQAFNLPPEQVKQIITESMAQLKQPAPLRILRQCKEALLEVEREPESPHAPGCVRTGKVRVGYRVYSTPQKSEGGQQQQDRRFANRNIYMPVNKVLHAIMCDGAHHFEADIQRTRLEPYPKALFHMIENSIGTILKPRHIQDFWNNDIPYYLGFLRQRVPSLDADRLGQLVSILLRSHMQPQDTVRLSMPPGIAIGYIGSWAQKGTIIVEGDVGDYAGLGMSGTASLIVNGSVGAYCGKNISGSAQIEVQGDAGNYAAHRARGSAAVIVRRRA